MTRFEYVDYRVENMTIAEAKIMNEWELAGEAAQVWDYIHSDDFARYMLETQCIEITEDEIAEIFCAGIESDPDDEIASYLWSLTY